MNLLIYKTLDELNQDLADYVIIERYYNYNASLRGTKQSPFYINSTVNEGDCFRSCATSQ